MKLFKFFFCIFHICQISYTVFQGFVDLHAHFLRNFPDNEQV